ncbi:MAG: hypothetical protein ACPL7K_02305, partial [Armatimonadota bacterium]
RRKEVFAWFGGAAYHAQCFEVELQSLLLLTHRLDHPEAPISELDRVDMQLSSKNLGCLIRELEKRFVLRPEFSALLKTYREKRNYLMHRFFFENASKLLTPRGGDAMVKELKELSRIFREADAIAQGISKRLRGAAGWSEEEIEALVRVQLKKLSGEDGSAT